MVNIIRSDYTLINRLEGLSYKYLNLHKGCNLLNRKSINYFHMYMRVQRIIEEIKEDMRLNTLQKINDVSVNVRGFTKEEADVYYRSLEEIYKPIGVNINNI